MNMKLFLSLVFTILGCSYQIIDISNRYFSYKTKPFTTVEIVWFIHLPATSVCWPFDDVMKQVKEWKNQSKDEPSTTNQIYEPLQTLAIADIFNSTPSTEEVLAINSACAVRLPKELAWRHPWYNRSECQHIFVIDKYVHRLSLCYRFTPREDIEKIYSGKNNLSPSKPGFIYMLFLNPKIFSHVSSFTAYGHSRLSSQLFDSYFSIEKKIRGHPFRIGVMSTPITIHDLPAPYDTECRTTPRYRSGQEYILDRLNNQTMEKMKYVHTLGHVHKPLLYPILTPSDFRKEGIRNLFNDLFDEAMQNHFHQCHFRYNIPKTRLEEDERITIAVNWPQDNELRTTRIPDQIIIDFIIYVCSSIGIWLGLSVLSAMKMVFDLCGKKEATKVEARASNDYERSIDSKLRDIRLITSDHSQVLCNLVKAIDDQKDLIQNQAVQIDDQKNLIQNLASRIRENEK